MINNPIRVLLIDDHKSFMDGLAMVIDSQSPMMEVVGMATNRAEALTAASALKPDLVLMDMDLGNSLSLDFLPELLEKTPTKVLMLTGLQRPDLHESAIVKGARGVLLKGESAKVILKAIERVNAGEIWASNSMLGRVIEKISHSDDREDEQTIRENAKISDLTAREREIIRTLVIFEASTNEEIAAHLFISKSTLKNHLTTIYSKLELKNRIELLKYALSHKIAESEK